jgi:chromatin segregation and condensation protein Rec8/ScpA/Scc1 (kleisin family)
VKGTARPRVVDGRTDLPAGARAAALPQNEELEDLFEVAKRQFAPPAALADGDSGGDGEFAAPAYDELSEVERNRDAPQFPDEQSSDELTMPRRESITGDDIELEPRRSISGFATPVFVRAAAQLESPFPNYKFAVEATPRRSVENSVTTQTIHTLNKIGTAMGGRESITFEQAFAGASRHGAAFAFYQVLVLRSTGAVGLSQEEPFGTIRITPGQQFGIAS